MATIKAVAFERSGVAKGLKMAALVLVMTAAALAADHVFFVAPSARPVATAVTSTAEAPATDALKGFALPEHLRPTTEDVDASPTTF